MAQRLKDDLREKIERSAMEVMLEKGVDNADMRSIARRAGCTTGNIYRYYPGKDRLILTLLKPLTDRLSRIISRRTGGSITLMGDAGGIKPNPGGMDAVEYLRFLLHKKMRPLLISLGEEGRLHPAPMKLLIEDRSLGDRLIEWTVETVQRIFYACIEVETRYEYYVNVLIRTFTHSFCYGVLQLLIANENLDGRRYRRLTDRFMNMQLNGICSLVEREIKNGTVLPRKEVFNG